LKINYVYCNKPDHNSGFSLIEVLVSITMMAMVAVVVLSAMRSGLAMWDKGGNHIEALRHSRFVVDVLHDQIRGALPITYTLRVNDRIVSPLAFEGDRTSLRFVSRTSFKDGPDGIARWIQIRWIAGSNSSAGALNVEERRILPPDNAPDAVVYWQGTILRSQSCSFDFLAAQPNKPPVWLQEWRYTPNTNTTLPKAVRLNCVLQGNDTMKLLVPLDYAASSAEGLSLR
jgi:prepilin-type N-terminal cleavage/methylation domain-containing protein